MTDLSDLDWIAQAQARRYGRWIAGTCLELDDLVQAGRVGIWHGMSRWRECAGASRETWATIQARARIRRLLELHLNTVRAPTVRRADGTRRRQLTRVPMRDVGDLDWVLRAPDAELADNSCLARAMSALKPRWQYLLTLRFAADCTLEEIASELGVSRQAVDHQIRRALSHLREQLTE